MPTYPPKINLPYPVDVGTGRRPKLRPGPPTYSSTSRILSGSANKSTARSDLVNTQRVRLL
eukprot:3779468-Pyramimonas_sp.AAC.1